MTQDLFIPNPSLHNVVSYQILSNGNVVNPVYELMSMVITREMNKVPAAASGTQTVHFPRVAANICVWATLSYYAFFRWAATGSSVFLPSISWMYRCPRIADSRAAMALKAAPT